MNVLVTGGTGVLGRQVVDRLLAAGHAVRILSRSGRVAPRSGITVVAGDLRTGDGLPDALAGVDVIVHTASDPKNFAEVDVDGTKRLIAAAAQAGVCHLIYISIVGVDRIPWPYYRAKLAVERLIEESGLPATILRATQFHEFTVDMLGRLSRLPVAVAPRGWRIQPIDVGVVAARLVDAVAAGPGGPLPDLAGPQVITWADAVRAIATARGDRVRIVNVPVPGRFSAAWRSGAALAQPSAGRTFAEFLAERAPEVVR